MQSVQRDLPSCVNLRLGSKETSAPSFIWRFPLLYNISGMTPLQYVIDTHKNKVMGHGFPMVLSLALRAVCAAGPT